MMGWTGMNGGLYAVRVAKVSLRGILAPDTIAAQPATDDVLAGLATGPDDDLLALWTATPRPASGPDWVHVRVVAARGVDVPGPVASFAPAQTIGGPGELSRPAGAIDPTTDRAVVAWLGGQEPASLFYAVSGA